DSYRQFREQAETVLDVFAFAALNDLNVSFDRHAVLADGQLVSGNYFKGLSVVPVLGRPLTDEDDRLANPVVVISYRFWQRELDRNAGVIGKAIFVNGTPATIVGVAPDGFVGTEGFAGPRDIFVPIGLQPQLSPRSRLASPWQWWV